MSLIDNIKSYFNKKINNEPAGDAPGGVCPNCWGKQEWEGEFYKKIKANNITPEHNTYNSFINEVAKKLDKITLKEDTLVCETCKVSYKE
jgi:protein-arginine kinase activator protein McsA